MHDATSHKPFYRLNDDAAPHASQSIFKKSSNSNLRAYGHPNPCSVRSARKPGREQAMVLSNEQPFKLLSVPRTRSALLDGGPRARAAAREREAG
eukprot:scaffold12456_cov131-Isochrysis_galbana.AAC.2